MKNDAEWIDQQVADFNKIAKNYIINDK